MERNEKIILKLEEEEEEKELDKFLKLKSTLNLNWSTFDY
jgi:hypothetical protein